MAADNVTKYEEASVTEINKNDERRLIHTDHLMLAVIDFRHEPTGSPEPFHHHIHEQVAYIAAGEILLFVGDKKPVRLGKGDMYRIEPDVPHTIQTLTKHVRIVDCFTPLREDFLEET